MDATKENKKKVLGIIRELLISEKMTIAEMLDKANVALADNKHELRTPWTEFVSSKTLKRIRDKPSRTVQKPNFQKLVWFLRLCNIRVVGDLISRETFGSTLHGFINPDYESIDEFAAKIVGNYLGYRLSINNPGDVIVFHLSIEQDKLNSALITREVVKNIKMGSAEVFEGTMVLNLEDKRNYIIARVVKDVKITGLQFTTFRIPQYDNEGNIIQMTGVVSGANGDIGVFTRNVVYMRLKTELDPEDSVSKEKHVTHECRFIPIDEFVSKEQDGPIRQRNMAILNLLRKPIDPHLNVPKKISQ